MIRSIIILCMFCFILISCQRIPPPKPGTEAYKISQAGYRSCKIYTADFSFATAQEQGRLMQEYFYNENGHVTEMVRYNIDGTENHRIKTDLTIADTLGQNDQVKHISQTIEVTQMDSPGEAVRRELQVFDKDGNMVEKVVLNANNDTLRMNKYHYNEWGLITEDIYYENDLKVPVQVIRYSYSR